MPNIVQFVDTVMPRALVCTLLLAGAVANLGCGESEGRTATGSGGNAPDGAAGAGAGGGSGGSGAEDGGGAGGGACVPFGPVHDAIGRYHRERGYFILEATDGSGAQRLVPFALPGGAAGLPVAGDWDRDGFDGLGLYDPNTNTFYLKNEASEGAPDHVVQLGPPLAGALPIAGDWNHDHRDTPGFFVPAEARFYLTDSLASAAPTIVFQFGAPNANFKPLAGDWNGDSTDTVGLYDPPSGTFFLRNALEPGPADQEFVFGAADPRATPLAGDWDRDTTDTIGLHVPAQTIFLRNANAAGPADQTDLISIPSDALVPLAGRWRMPDCAASGINSTPPAPDWASSLILYQLRPDRFTPEGTFKAFAAELPYLRDLGVTGIVTTPLALANAPPDPEHVNAYVASVPDQLDPRFGTEADFKTLIATAHAQGIKVIVDVVTNGLLGVTEQPSPYLASHPDWFRRTPEGDPIIDWGTQAQLDWTHLDLRRFWIDTMVSWVGRFDVDGFRVDLEPHHSGTALWSTIGRQVEATLGKRIFLMSEGKMPGRGFAFHCSQHDFGSRTAKLSGEIDFFGGTHDLVEVITAPEQRETFYSATLSNHDYSHYVAGGRLGPFGYGMLLAPFIPHWFMGEEFNAPENLADLHRDGPLYFNHLDLTARTTNRAFLERVKKLIQIRNAYKDIVAPFTTALNQTPITKLTTTGSDLPAYALYSNSAARSGGTAIVVIGKNRAARGAVTIDVPLEAMKMGGHASYAVTDLLRDETTNHAASALHALSIEVEPGDIAVLAIVAR